MDGAGDARAPDEAFGPATRAEFDRAAKRPRQRRRDLAAFPRRGGAHLGAWNAGGGAPGGAPRPLTRLVGREHELAALRALLESARLVTLTGPPGVGKTRIALELAERLADAFPGGVRFAPLGGVDDASLLLPTLAAALGVHDAGGQPLLARIGAVVASRPTLLVLDNCEHLAADAGPLVRELLSGCAGLTVLATSRAPLAVRGEREFPVPPLPLPDPARLPGAAALAENPAVALFVDRAAAADPAFRLGSTNARAVAEICVRLDGLPLAIELAAARAKLLPPEALLPRLDRRLAVLAGRARDLPPRHRTLRAAVDASYALLSPRERRLHARLAVFSGGFTLAAAEAVGATTAAERAALLDDLAALLDQSLLRRSDDREPRLTMLETLREYALERLEASGQTAAARRAHAEHVLGLAEAAVAGLTGPDQSAWLERLEREHDNVRAALAWALDAPEPRGRTIAVRLAGALWRFWAVRGHLGEGRRWLEAALARAGDAPAPARAEALRGAAFLAADQGDYVVAARRHVASLALLSELGDRRGVAEALNNLGMVLCDRAQYRAARHCFEQSLAAAREVGDRRGAAGALNNLGRVARDEGDLARAEALHAESLALRRALGDTRGVALSLGSLGLVAHRRGDERRAAALHAEGLALARELGAARDVAFGLERLAAVAAGLGQGERAARLFGAAEALREQIGAPLAPAHRADLRRDLAAARRAASESAFAAAWAEGRALPLEDAVAEALALGRDGGEALARPAPVPLVRPLSAREREVAALLAQGLSNREIAARLVVAERTAEAHVEHIRTKLGVRSRAEIAAWARRHGLAGAE